MRLVFFGDGFVKGIGDPDQLGFAGRLAKSAGLQHVNLAQDGATSADVLRCWQGNEHHHHAAGFVFSYGAEDCLFGDHKRPKVGQLERLKNTKALMMAARAQAPVLFISPFPVIGREKALPCIANTARQMSTIARANKVDYINVFDALQASDLWHVGGSCEETKYPQDQGYAQASKMIAQNETWQSWLTKLKR